MKNLLILVLLITVTNLANAQDLIVTNEGDSINCKITKVKTDNIYFTFKHKDEIRSTLLPISKVKLHQLDFYQTSEVPKEKLVGYENYQRFRIAINGGYSYHTAKISNTVPSDFKDYIKKLKSGSIFSGDLTYYISEPLGLGVKYSLSKYSNSLGDIYLEDMYGDRTYGMMKDEISISFIGPAFSTRFLNHDKSNAFLMSLSLGYMGYSNNKVLIDRYKITGSTMAMALDFGYDIGLNENLSLGFQISFVTASLNKLHMDDGITKQTIKLEKGEYEGLNRIDFSVGLRFGK